MILGVNCHPKNDEGTSRSYQYKKLHLSKERDIKLEVSKGALLDLIVEMRVDPQGLMYFADALDGTIKIFNSDGKYISSISKGSTPPMSITGFYVSKNGNIFVSDLLTESIYEFSRAGSLVNRFPVDSASRFVMGIPRVHKNGLYVGLLEMKYGLDFFRSSIVGIYDLANGNLLKRFGAFDEIYTRFDLLSPEVNFDISEEGIIYIVQCHSYKIFCYDTSGKHIATFGERSETFREPVSAAPKDKAKYIEWLTTWSNMNLVQATRDFIIAQYCDRYKSSNPFRFRMDCFADVYKLDGKLIENGIRLPGRLLFARGDSLYVGTDLDSDEKIVSIFTLEKAVLQN